MKSTHDYRGEYAATRRRYGRAFNRWRRGAGSFIEQDRLCLDMFAAERRYHAQLNKPKRKTSKRASRRARAYLTSLARLIEQSRTVGPRPVRIHVRDASELPAVRVETPVDDMGLGAFRARQGIPVVVVPELEPGFGFIEYSDGSLQKVRIGSGATT